MKTRYVAVLGTVFLLGLACEPDVGQGPHPDGAVGDFSLVYQDGTSPPPGDGPQVLPGDGPRKDSTSQPPKPPPVPGKSGSQLRRMFYEAGGVRVLQRTPYDNVLGTRCSWRVTKDNQVRCVPWAARFIHPTKFRNATCTISIASIYEKTANMWRTCGMEAKPIYVVSPVQTGKAMCGGILDLFGSRDTIWRSYQLTSRYDVKGGFYEKDSNGKCVKGNPTSVNVYYNIKEIDPSGFSKGKLKDGPSGSRLKERRIVTDGGLEVQAALYDTKNSEYCGLLLQKGGGYGCIPNVGVPKRTKFSSFGDASCSGERLFEIQTFSCGNLKYGLDADFGKCDGIVSSSVKLGSRVLKKYSVFSDKVCRESTASFIDTYKKGSDVNSSEFVAGSFLAFPSSGRIKPYLGKADGLSISSGLFWDSNFNATCSPGKTSDGALRCLPVGQGVSLRYLDSACKQRVLGASCELAAGQKLVAVSDDGPGYTCLGIFSRVFSVGPEIAPTPSKIYRVVHKDTGKDCVATTSFSHVYTLGKERPQGDFVAVKEVIE